MTIPSAITLDDLKKEPVTPVGHYAERFHHYPPTSNYRWIGEEKIDALCRKALEEDRPVESWAIARCGSWAWGEPPGEGPPAGMRLLGRGRTTRSPTDKI